MGYTASGHRTPYQGLFSTLDGQGSIPPVLGPLSTDLGGVKLFMQAVISQRPWLKDSTIQAALEPSRVELQATTAQIV
jgi:amidase